MIILCNNDKLILEAPHDYKIAEVNSKKSSLNDYFFKYTLRKWVENVSDNSVPFYYFGASFVARVAMPDELSSAFALTFEPIKIYNDLEEYVDFLKGDISHLTGAYPTYTPTFVGSTTVGTTGRDGRIGTAVGTTYATGAGQYDNFGTPLTASPTPAKTPTSVLGTIKKPF